MSIIYNIYSNGGSGGPVDYSTPIGTTAELTFAVGPVGVSTDTTYAVRACDTITGLEEANSDATARLVVAPDGTDVSAAPNAPHAVSLSPAPGGSCRVTWAYAPATPYGRPDGFQVSVGAVGGGDAPRSASVAYRAGTIGYSVVLPGPFAAGGYAAAVAAFNAAGGGAVDTAAANLPGPPATDFDLGPVTIAYL